MNGLVQKYGAQGLVVLGFACNQFAFQENMANSDILNILRYVRPGKGFAPLFNLFQKTDVNGATADILFQWLKKALPLPSDDPYGVVTPMQEFLLWAPASRTDIDWNFSKFLVGRNGVPLKRWSSATESDNPSFIADLEAALKNQTVAAFPQSLGHAIPV